MSQIQSLPILTNPLYTDYDITIDSQDSNKTKRTQIWKKVKAGLSDPAITADDINQGSSKKLMTVSEQTKLTNIEPNAQVNLLERVNGQTGSWPSKNLNLTLDNIPDGITRKAWSVAFWSWESSQLSTAYVHSQQTGNPHGTTASQVGLGQVANERQLSRTAGNFNALPVRSDIQREFNDLVPIQDDFDSDTIKTVSVGTQYIRYASHIQLWRPSVNYHADTLISSTTYEIRSIVINEWDNKLYYCLVPHQSTGSFASDLANGYWMAVAGGSGWSSPVYVIHASTNPTQSIPWWPRTPSGAFVWQVFVNTVTGDISIWDGNDRVLNSATGGWGWGSGIIYSLSNGTVVASTTGNRGLASTGTGADKTYETSQVIDPVTWNTISQTFWPWGTVVFDDTDINFENWTTLNYDSTVVSNHNWDTVNYDWSTINSTNTEYNHTGDTINYDSTTTVEWGVFTNNTFNNATFTWSSVIAGALVTDYIPWNIATTVYTLSNIPSGTIQVSTQGWVIQIEPSDYTHTDNTITFTGNVNRTGVDLIVTYIKWVAVTAPSLKVWPITRTPAWSSFTHTNALSTATSVVNGISIISWTVNWNYFDFDTSIAWQITFTSKDFLWNSVSENGIVFYYTVNY